MVLAALVVIAAFLVPAWTLPDREHPSHQDVRKPIRTPVHEGRDSLRWGIFAGGVLVAGFLVVEASRSRTPRPN
jgi:hypothetical protein